MGNRHNVEVTASLLYGRGRSGHLVPMERNLLTGTTENVAVYRKAIAHDNRKRYGPRSWWRRTKLQFVLLSFHGTLVCTIIPRVQQESQHSRERDAAACGYEQSPTARRAAWRDQLSDSTVEIEVVKQ